MVKYKTLVAYPTGLERLLELNQPVSPSAFAFRNTETLLGGCTSLTCHWPCYVIARPLMLGQCLIQTEAYADLLGLGLSFQSAVCPKSISLQVQNKPIIINVQTMGLRQLWALKYGL